MLNCKEVTHLLSQSQDRPLSMGERLPLEMHLLMCQGCANYRKQLDFLREACKNHPAGVSPSSHKESP